jgi:hypothetical protein
MVFGSCMTIKLTVETMPLSWDGTSSGEIIGVSLAGIAVIETDGWVEQVDS